MNHIAKRYMFFALQSVLKDILVSIAKNHARFPILAIFVKIPVSVHKTNVTLLKGVFNKEAPVTVI